MRNCYPKSRDLTTIGKNICQKVVRLHLYCHNFVNTCPQLIKNVFSDSSCFEFPENKSHLILRGPKFDLVTSL